MKRSTFVKGLLALPLGVGAVKVLDQADPPVYFPMTYRIIHLENGSVISGQEVEGEEVSKEEFMELGRGHFLGVLKKA